MCGGGSGDNEIKETPEEKALAEIAKQQYEHGQKFDVYKQDFMDRVDRMDSTEEFDRNRATVGKAYNNATSQVADRVMDTARAGGVDPSTSSFQATAQASLLDMAGKGADARSRTDMDSQRRATKGVESVVAMGQGKAVDGLRGMADVAVTAHRSAADDAYDVLNRQAGNARLAGQVIGAGGRMAVESMGADTKPEIRKGK